MIGGNNWDAVFVEIADAVINDPRTRNKRMRFIFKVKAALDQQGVSKEAMPILEAKSREIFNTRTKNPSERFDSFGPFNQRLFARRTSENDKRQRGDGQTRRYNNDNVVPRTNGTHRETT